MKNVYTNDIKTTSPVSIIFDGFILQKWIEQSLWNQTRASIVRNLNEYCKKDFRCDAEYGNANVHLLNAVQYGASSIRLNITADKPILPFNTKIGNSPVSYNYTALLTGALLRTKIDIERLHDKSLIHSSTYSNSISSRTSRLLFVLLGIFLVAVVFGLTVLFFQRIRHHSYRKLLKTPRIYQTTQDEPLTDSPSTAVLHE
ncbi:unnamed protein product [Adineta steineri]|uniref:Uncharacterized protein n=1 Tax=Adineta steineri TaxID=433720 RepID=A0A814ZRK6_9BILA|nr:unnamed protein product [Adineta steineri]CAF1247207.1 unnamed protein product [Adineta steineri]